MYTVTRYHDISTGHRVYGHESKCAHLHGHNYRITFTCGPEPEQDPALQLDRIGRVIDFSVIKQRLCLWLEDAWDHRFLVYKDDPACEALLKIDPLGIVVVPFNPTAENMAEYLVNHVGPLALQGTGVKLLKVSIEETRKCSAAFEAD